MNTFVLMKRDSSSGFFYLFSPHRRRAMRREILLRRKVKNTGGAEFESEFKDVGSLWRRLRISAIGWSMWKRRGHRYGAISRKFGKGSKWRRVNSTRVEALLSLVRTKALQLM